MIIKINLKPIGLKSKSMNFKLKSIDFNSLCSLMGIDFKLKSIDFNFLCSVMGIDFKLRSIDFNFCCLLMGINFKFFNVGRHACDALWKYRLLQKGIDDVPAQGRFVLETAHIGPL